MNTQNIYSKIKKLPEEQLEQVSDYIDFLMIKNKLELNPDEKLEDEDRRILDERYEEFKANKDEAMELNDLKNELLKKYGK